MRKYNLGALIILMLIMIFGGQSRAQENPQTENKQSNNLNELIADGVQEIDFYSLEALLDIEVEVASLFVEDELVVGSMVSSISSDQWNKLGARRTSDALSNELSVVTYQHILGNNVIVIRGYTTDASNKGVAYLIDGVPVNAFTACDISQTPNFDLGALDRIELIKGPGSAIYGSDAFHGVISMKTFESDKDTYSINLGGAYPLYGDANVKISQGFSDNLFRINFAAATSGQTAQKQEYDYDHPATILPAATDAVKGSGERGTKYQSDTGVLKFVITPGEKLNIRLGSYINYGSFGDYPGLTNYATTGSLEKHDTSFNDVLSHFENCSVAYEMPERITIEANGYFYWYKQNAEITIDSIGGRNYNNYKGERAGTSLIIKQPNNAINLQWLIAYSLSYMKSLESTSHVKILKPGITTPWDQITEAFTDRDRTINSAFSQLKWGAIKNRLYLLAGGRLDNYSDYGNQVTPRGGIIFLPTEKSSIKALYGRAFRAATATELYGIAGYTNPNEDLKPETIDIYEGIYMYKEKKWKITLNSFYSKWKNGIITELDLAKAVIGDAPYDTVNKGTNEAYGGEGSIFYAFGPFAVDLGLSYTKSKAINIIRYSFSTFPPVKEEIDKEDYVAYPEYIAKAGLYYTLKPYMIEVFLNNRFYYKMKETHYNMKSEPDDLPLYWRMDLNISKNITEKADINLDVHNIANRKNHIPSLFGAEDGNEEPGISVLLRAGYKL